MIFLDTSFLIALLIEENQNHEKSLKLMRILEFEKKMINSTVLIELLNSLDKRNLHMDLKVIVEYLFNLDGIYFLNDIDYKDSIEIFQRYGFSINYADCTILHTMFKNRINTIVSFESDFDKIKGIQRICL